MSQNHVDFYVFIDGFGWELLKIYPEFLKDHLITQNKTESVLGYSNTCIPSILTGKKPDEHLQWASYYRATDKKPFESVKKLSWLPNLLANNAKLRRYINQRLSTTNEFTGYFETYQIPFTLLSELAYTETRDIFQPMYFNDHPNIFMHWQQRNLSYEVHYLGSDQLKSEALHRTVSQRGELPKKLYLHLNQLDGVLHANAKSSERVRGCLLATESYILKSLDALRKNGAETRLHVFSDHGMCTVKTKFNLKQHIEKHSGRTSDELGFSFYDATMARFWPKNKTSEKLLTGALGHSEFGHVLNNLQREELGVSKQKLPHYGDVVFLAHPGVILIPNDLSRKAPYAMHGYDPTHEDSFGVYLSNVSRQDSPTSITDIFRDEFLTNA